jgi:hypothetical protein
MTALTASSSAIPTNPIIWSSLHTEGIGSARRQAKITCSCFTSRTRRSGEEACLQMLFAGFRGVPSYNPFWNVCGRTFEDLDGYRVVLQNAEWTK